MPPENSISSCENRFHCLHNISWGSRDSANQASRAKIKSSCWFWSWIICDVFTYPPERGNKFHNSGTLNVTMNHCALDGKKLTCQDLNPAWGWAPGTADTCIDNLGALQQCLTNTGWNRLNKFPSHLQSRQSNKKPQLRNRPGHFTFILSRLSWTKMATRCVFALATCFHRQDSQSYVFMRMCATHTASANGS